MQARPNDDDTLIDPLDDGTGPLAPGQFDPLCEVRGEPYIEEPIGYVTRDMATDACEPLMEGMPVYGGSDRTDAELHGEPWPADSMQAAGYEYEIAHWR